MIDDLELLYLQAPVGKGQENNPDDVEALDAQLRTIKAYAPPPEYADSPQRYTTEAMIGALERYQEQNGLKIDGVVMPGGPTERAVNNRLLAKPRGAGLLYDPPSSLAGTVGSGFENRRGDVAGVQRRLGALGYLPEDPFDKPHGFIDEATANGIRAFQRARRLADDGWLAPGGETERALDDAVADLARAKGHEWFGFVDRAAKLERATAMKGASPAADISSSQGDEGADEEEGITLAKVTQLPAPTFGNAHRGTATPRRLEPRGLLEVDPRFVPPPRLRWSEPLPRDLEFRNPGERPSGPPLRTPRLNRPTKPEERLSIDDVPRALGLPKKPPADEEIKRALPIVPRRDQPDVYVPQPGSPLRIPVIDINRGGISGDPRTIQTTEDTTTALKEACEDVFDAAKFERKDVEFKRKREKYYNLKRSRPGTTKGSSFADEWMGMIKPAENLTIDFITDSYTPKVDGTPTRAEDGRYMKLEHNMEDRQHVVTVRVPKAWTLGQSLNKDKLQKAAREICEQIKKMIDEGAIRQDNRTRIRRMLKELVEPKKKPSAPKPDKDDIEPPR